MNKIVYLPAKDELQLKFCSMKGRQTKEIGTFKLWWDDKGHICAFAIKNFTQELKEFNNIMNTIQLESIWKGVNISEEDIIETRQDLLKQLEGKW